MTRDDDPIDPAARRQFADSYMPYLGELTFAEFLDRCMEAGITVSYHDILPAQLEDEIDAAREEGRLVARFRMRVDPNEAPHVGDPGESGLALKTLPPPAAEVGRRLVIAERRALWGGGEPAVVQQLAGELMDALDVE